MEAELEEVPKPNADGSWSAIRQFRSPSILEAATTAIARDFKDDSKVGFMVYRDEGGDYAGGLFFRLGDHITFMAAGLKEKGQNIGVAAKVMGQWR